MIVAQVIGHAEISPQHLIESNIIYTQNEYTRGVEAGRGTYKRLCVVQCVYWMCRVCVWGGALCGSFLSIITTFDRDAMRNGSRNVLLCLTGCEVPLLDGSWLFVYL